MTEIGKVLETFTSDVVGGVYDTIDLTTRYHSAKSSQVAALEAEYREVTARIHELRRRLTKSPPPMQEAEGELTEDQKQRADNLQRCLTMSGRMTACQFDTQGRLTCGGVALKPGDRFDSLQANWDLIDTVTGADA